MKTRNILAGALLAGLGFGTAAAQTNVGINNPSPNATAALDVTSTTQGMLVPRMTQSQRNQIPTVNGVGAPATGLLIYQTDNTPGFYFYNGTAWTSLNSGGSTDIYAANGSLSGARAVNLNGNNLDFTGTGNLGLNGNALRLQAATNGNHFLQYNATTDGPILSGNSGGKLSYGTAGANTAMSWASTGVTVNSSTSSYTLPTGRGTNGQVLTTNGSGATSWAAAGAGSGAKVELVAKKAATTQPLPLSTAAADILVYDNVTTAPTMGTFSNNAYTAGASGVYLIQTRNTVVPISPSNNQLGTYNWLELNGAAIGSYDNIYPTYVSNGSQGGVTPAALKSSTSYTFVLFLNVNDVIRIRATGLNSAVAQTLNNDGGTQISIFKL